MSNDTQINAQELLEQLMNSGKQLAARGRELAEQGMEYAKGGVEQAKDKIGDQLEQYVELPPPGAERDELFKKIGATAAVGGILALLVGTKSGRKILSPVIKVGSVAALGAVGFKAYEKWKEQNGITSDGQSIANLEGDEAAQRSEVILRAMVSAALADGSISGDEQDAVNNHIQSAGLEEQSAGILMSEISNPSGAAGIAGLSNSTEMGVDLYLASLAVTGVDNAADRNYLSELAQSLNLDGGLVEQIHTEAGFAM